MSVCVDLTCVDNWQFSDNLVGWSISSYCKSQQDRIEIFLINWCVHDGSGRSQDHWPGYQWLLINWDHALEVQRWKKVKILNFWPGSVHGYGVREKEPDEKMGPVWCHRADLPLTSKGGGRCLGTSVTPGEGLGDQSLQRRLRLFAGNSWSRQGAHLRVLMTPGRLGTFHLPPAFRVGGWWGTTSITIR